MVAHDLALAFLLRGLLKCQRLKIILESVKLSPVFIQSAPCLSAHGTRLTESELNKGIRADVHIAIKSLTMLSVARPAWGRSIVSSAVE